MRNVFLVSNLKNAWIFKNVMSYKSSHLNKDVTLLLFLSYIWSSLLKFCPQPEYVIRLEEKLNFTLPDFNLRSSIMWNNFDNYKYTFKIGVLILI